MRTSIMMKRIAEGSPRLKARTAGALYLNIIVVASEFTGISLENVVHSRAKHGDWIAHQLRILCQQWSLLTIHR